MAGRIETYLHSDKTTENKGGCICEVTCETDFAARTPEFKKFAKYAAQCAYATQKSTWAEIADLFPAVAQAMAETQATIKETITVRRVVILTLTPEAILKEERQKAGG